MWFVVLMMADDWDSAIIQLSDSEYEVVKKFLQQIEEQRHPLSWVGGHWKISHPSLKGTPLQAQLFGPEGGMFSFTCMLIKPVRSFVPLELDQVLVLFPKELPSR